MMTKYKFLGTVLSKNEMKEIKGGTDEDGNPVGCPSTCDTLRDCASNRKCGDCQGGGRACFRD